MAAKLQPVSEKNLAAYDLGPLPWERALKHLDEEWRMQAPAEFGGTEYPHTHWLTTVRPDGRPHVVPVGLVWHDGAFYFSSGDGTEKSKHLARDPRCSISLAALDLDIVLDGVATKITDESKLQRVAEVFAVGGWAPTVKDGAFDHEFSAPSAGPSPWYVYEFTPQTVYGFATGEPYGATRWRF